MQALLQAPIAAILCLGSDAAAAWRRLFARAAQMLEPQLEQLEDVLPLAGRTAAYWAACPAAARLVKRRLLLSCGAL